MIKLKSVGVSLGLAVAMTSLLTANVQASTLNVAMNADIRSTDPGVNRDDNSDTVVLHIVEGLVAYREDTSVGPLLAESYHVSDDGLVYTFTLRQGVHFHNGEPLTSQEALWSWQRYLNPATQWRCLNDFNGSVSSKIVTVHAPDGQTLVFELDKPNALFLTSMARADCGGSGILHPDSVAADDSWVQPVGTGPFRLASWRPGQGVLLERFDGYQPRSEDQMDGLTGNKTAWLEQINFMVIPDSASAKAALLAGNVDVLPSVSIYDAREVQGQRGIKINSSPNMTMNTILMRTEDPLLKDPRIRRALALSIDADQIARAISDGEVGGNHSPVPVSSPYYNDVQKQGYKTDLDEARRLLKEAGYKGEPITMLVNNRYPNLFQIGIMSQAMAQSVGITLQLETLEWATQLERYQSGQYQMMAFSYSSRLDPALNFDVFMGDKSVQPRKVWDNPDARGWLQQAMLEQSAQVRQQLFDQLHEQFITDVPMLMINNGTSVGAVGVGVAGYQSWAGDKPRFWGVKLTAQ